MKKFVKVLSQRIIITIIVLIILAGISINSILGQNGIITKAKEAKQNIELAKIEEEEGLNEIYKSIKVEDSTQNETTTQTGLEDLLKETNATPDKILKDYKAYSNGELIIGTMKKNEPTQIILNFGENYIIPEGYHDGTGTITVKEPNEIIRYNATDKDNFVSTYNATKDCVVLATSFTTHKPESTSAYSTTKQSTSGTIISEMTHFSGHMRMIQKIYKLTDGQSVTCTSSAYDHRIIVHTFVIY